MKLSRRQLRRLINEVVNEEAGMLSKGFDKAMSYLGGGVAPKGYIQNKDEVKAEKVAAEITKKLGVKAEKGSKSRDGKKYFFVRVYTPFLPGEKGYNEEHREVLSKYGRIMGNKQDSEARKLTFVDPR